MITLRAPSGTSEDLRHAIELVNRDLDGLLSRLDTHQQNQFWTNLHQFALAETRHEGRRASLIASEHVDAGVREALETAGEQLAAHLQHLDEDDRARFWKMLHDSCENQAEQIKHPKAKHGGR